MNIDNMTSCGGVSGSQQQILKSVWRPGGSGALQKNSLILISKSAAKGLKNSGLILKYGMKKQIYNNIYNISNRVYSTVYVYTITRTFKL